MRILTTVHCDGKENISFYQSPGLGTLVVTIGNLHIMADDKATLDGILNQALNALHDAPTGEELAAVLTIVTPDKEN